MRATLVLCDTCRQAAIVINGVYQTAMELRQVNGKPAVTPHAADCEKVKS